MKKLAWIVGALLFLGLGTTSFYLRQALEENAKLNSSTHISSQILPALNKMAQDPNQQVEYTATIAAIGPLIVEQAKEDPKRFSVFLKETLLIAVKSDISLALRFQDYADSKVKEEMEQLRQESSVERLMVKDSEIAVLKEENSRLQKISREKDELATLVAGLRKQFSQTEKESRKKDDDTASLKTEVEKLQAIAKDRDNLFSSVGKLQEEIAQLKIAQAATPTPTPTPLFLVLTLDPKVRQERIEKARANWTELVKMADEAAQTARGSAIRNGYNSYSAGCARTKVAEANWIAQEAWVEYQKFLRK